MDSTFEPFDVLLDESFVQSLCECESCKLTYGKVARHIKAIEDMTSDDKKLMNNLDGNINDDEEEKKE